MSAPLLKTAAPRRRVLVAGDVCLDVVGVPLPPPISAVANPENWQLTGETRTHFLPGGAMLLAKFIRASRMEPLISEADAEARKLIKAGKLGNQSPEDLRRNMRNQTRLKHTREHEEQVIGPRPLKPKGINSDKSGQLFQDDFLEIAERLRRDEIVHSLISVNAFPSTMNPDEKSTTLRVERKQGFSGPEEDGSPPSLELEYSNDPVDIVVLDDTGNRFRKGDSGNPWPSVLARAKENGPNPLIVYKLHRPLPTGATSGSLSAGKNPEIANKLWDAVAENHRDNRIIIVSVDDLREAGAPISLGLSWERTALDVVWHLLHVERFAALQECPRLIVRLGLDGAVLWHGVNKGNPETRMHQAFLVYDPQGIEGSFALKVPGEMVSGGSAFAAAFVEKLAAADDGTFSVLLQSRMSAQKNNPSGLANADALVVEAIKEGLLASRRLFQLGFGQSSKHPNYPGPELFKNGCDVGSFCFHAIKIIPETNEPDRNYWRLLDSIFEGQTSLLHAAVALTATKRNIYASPEEEQGAKALKSVPTAKFGALQTYDRCEIESYRALHTLLRDYLCARSAQRPLSIAVFGPPGAGKSFGVKEVAAALKGQRDCKEVQELTFNLSLYQKPEELAGAFHLVRDAALRGKVPLVFFDEFDNSLEQQPLGWLRHFLAPMQDGEFLDRGAPHPIGQAIFVFAGGTCGTYREFASHPGIESDRFKALKGPDFLSRLRATLDIPSLNFLTASEAEIKKGQIIQPLGTFDPYGPVVGFPCQAAILLRRANILAFNLPKKGPNLKRADGSLAIKPEVLRALLHLPQFEHGNRSFEALLDMSHLAGAADYIASLLPPPFQMSLHANAQHMAQLVSTDFPFPPKELDLIAEEIHKAYLAERRRKKLFVASKASHKKWKLLSEFYRDRNRAAAISIPDKLRFIGLWFRKTSGKPSSTFPLDLQKRPRLIERLAQAEHDRWIADQRSQGYVYGPIEDHALLTHPDVKPWSELSKQKKDQDRDAVRSIPKFLAAGGYVLTMA
jgi:hypothetical protein